jgi:hypothetical protein
MWLFSAHEIACAWAGIDWIHAAAEVTEGCLSACVTDTLCNVIVYDTCYVHTEAFMYLDSRADA